MKDRTLVQGVKKGFGHKNLMRCFKICTNHNYGNSTTFMYLHTAITFITTLTRMNILTNQE